MVKPIAPSNRILATSQYAPLKRAIEHFKITPSQLLHFARLDTVSTRIVVLFNSWLGSARDLKSHLGYVIQMADMKSRANIAHYRTNKCHRVLRSFIAAAFYALVHAVDVGTVIREALVEFLNRKVEMEAYVDSETPFNVVTKNSNTAERRSRIYLFPWLESYQIGNLKGNKPISGNEDAVIMLTKEVLSQRTAMWNLMKTSKVNIDPVACATRNNNNERR